MPPRAVDLSSEEETASSYEEVPVEEPAAKAAEPEPELEGDTTSSEESVESKESKRGRSREKAASPRAKRARSPEVPEGTKAKRPRSPEVPEGNKAKRPRSPEMPERARAKRAYSPPVSEGGKAKGKSKGKDKGKKGGSKADEFVRCGICWQYVKNNACSRDQHQYWSVACNTWRRVNAGMSWSKASAAADRQKLRREQRHALEGPAVETVPKKKEPSRKDKAEKKEKKKEKKVKKTKRRVSPSPEPARPSGKKGGRPPSSSDEDEPRGSRGSGKQWTKVFHWVKL